MNKKRSLTAILGLCLLFLCAVGSYYGANAYEKQSCDVLAEKREVSKDTEEEMGVEVVMEESRIGEGTDNIAASEEIAITTEEPKEKTYYNKSRNLTISESDYQVLLRIVEAEATGGSLKSKRMVANVVLNRMENAQFPDTVSEVVFQKGSDGTAQFSPIADGRYEMVTITEDTKKAVKQVLQGEDETKGALFFLNRDTASYTSLCWFDEKLQYLFECGGHSYYCYK